MVVERPSKAASLVCASSMFSSYVFPFPYMSDGEHRSLGANAAKYTATCITIPDVVNPVCTVLQILHLVLISNPSKTVKYRTLSTSSSYCRGGVGHPRVRATTYLVLVRQGLRSKDYDAVRTVVIQHFAPLRVLWRG
jgi:hypothetical protein